MRRIRGTLGYVTPCLALFVLAGCGALLGVDSSSDGESAPPPPGAVDGSDPKPPPNPPAPEPTDASDASDEDVAADAIEEPFDCATGCNTGQCTSGKCDPLIFVTSVASASDGSLGGVGAVGVARADARCNAIASAVGLHNTFAAWISDETTNATAHVADSGRPLRRKDGMEVAPNVSWLASTNALLAPVRYDESGIDVGAATVWTGTSTNGTKNAGSTCTNWTSADTNQIGQFGVANATNFAWVASTAQSCGSSKASLYCIEKP